jgi:hypothetical protein
MNTDSRWPWVSAWWAPCLLLICLEICASAVLAQDEVAPVAQQAVAPPQVVMAPQAGVRKPAKGVSQQSGLAVTMLVKESAPPAFGYATLNIDFESPSPLTADTSVTVQVHLMGYYNTPNLTVEGDLELLAGDTKRRLELRIPAHALGYVMTWDIRVDGRLDRTLSQRRDFYQPVPTVISQGQNRNEAVLRVLCPPSLNPLPKLVDSANITTLLTPDTSVVQFSSGSDSEVVQQELPEEWIEYSPYDIVMLDVATLAALKTDRPKAFEALNAWVHSGGNLWINDVGKSWERLGEINRLMNLPVPGEDVLPEPPKEGIAEGSRSWNFIDLTINASLDQSELDVGMADMAGPTYEEVVAPDSPVRKRLSDDWFAVRNVGWGTVAAYQTHFSDRPRAYRESDTTAALRFWVRRSWTHRHGTDPRYDNPAFSDWLIPDVGMAPVLEFEFLITLFVIVIGPLNYWLLKRAKRLHLLVITVPAFAALVTFALLSYGVLADGLADRVRSMSLTYIDRGAKQCSTWNRLSYYSAFAPRHGLSFPVDSQVYSIEPGDDDGYSTPATVRNLRLDWTGEAQQLSRGWLNSRTPTQYLVIETRQGVRGLELTPSSESVAGKSHFEAPLALVLALDTDGRWLRADDVAARGKFTLHEVTEEEAKTRLRKVLQDREPSIPAAMGDARLPWSVRRRFGWSHGYSTSFDESLLSDRWKRLAGRDGYEMLGIAPQSYLVVGHHSLGASLGLEGVEEEASLHIVFGEW